MTAATGSTQGGAGSSGGDGYSATAEDLRHGADLLKRAGQTANMPAANLRGQASLEHAIPFGSVLDDNNPPPESPPPEEDKPWWEDAADAVVDFASTAVDVLTDAATPGAFQNIDAMAKGVIGAIKGPYNQAISAMEAFSTDVDRQLRELGSKLGEAATTYEGTDSVSAETFSEQESEVEQSGGSGGAGGQGGAGSSGSGGAPGASGGTGGAARSGEAEGGVGHG